jgi:hypothetical protein
VTGVYECPSAASGRYLPFVAELMAEPSLDHPVIPLLEVLPALEAERYSVLENILLPDGDERVPAGEVPSRAFDSVLGQREKPSAPSRWRRSARRQDPCGRKS